MQFSKPEGCVKWHIVTMVIGVLSFMGSIVGATIAYINTDHYGHYRIRHYSDNLPEMCIAMFCILQVCASVLLIVGAATKKPVLMFPWLGTYLTIIVIAISVSIALAINGLLLITRMVDVGYFVATLGVFTAITAVASLLFGAVYINYNQLVSGKPTQSATQTLTEPFIIKSGLGYQKF